MSAKRDQPRSYRLRNFIQHKWMPGTEAFYKRIRKDLDQAVRWKRVDLIEYYKGELRRNY